MCNSNLAMVWMDVWVGIGIQCTNYCYTMQRLEDKPQLKEILKRENQKIAEIGEQAKFKATKRIMKNKFA